MRKTEYKSQLRDSLQNTCLVIIKTIKVIKNKEILETVTAKRILRRCDNYMKCDTLPGILEEKRIFGENYRNNVQCVGFS
jgi:hypothetical protein